MIYDLFFSSLSFLRTVPLFFGVWFVLYAVSLSPFVVLGPRSRFCRQE